MKKLKATTIYLFLVLFLATHGSFATGDTDNRKPKNDVDTEETTSEDACGFFCSVGEFLEGLFS